MITIVIPILIDVIIITLDVTIYMSCMTSNVLTDTTSHYATQNSKLKLFLGT